MCKKDDQRCSTERSCDDEGRRFKEEYFDTCKSSTLQWKEKNREGNVEIRRDHKMYFGSQVQDIGDKRDVTIEGDNCSKSIDCNKGTIGIDYVQCGICGFVGLCITKHVKKYHPEINVKSYKEKYGSTVSLKASLSAKNNGDWINKRKENGEDLTQYRQKLSSSVKEAILSSQKEIDRRSKLMALLNKRSDYRKRASIIAKLTSQRPDIIKNRSKKLANWRENNKDEFYEKCTHAMHATRTSKPEKWVLNFLQLTCQSYNFVGNKRIIDENYFHLNKTHSKQVDIISLKKKIIVEIDGPLHFINISSWNQLEGSQQKDIELNNFAKANDFTLIRISYDQWNVLGELCDSAQQSLLKMIDNTPGIYFIGEFYFQKIV